MGWTHHNLNSHTDILVTGSSGVIGRAIVSRLAHAGYHVHLAGRDKNRLLSLQKQLSSAGFDAPLYLIKLSNLAAAEKIVKDFFRKAKNPFGLVCNAGNLGPVGLYWKTPIKTWRQSITENFLSHAAMIHAFAKAMSGRKQREGSIAVLSGAGVGSVGDFSNVTSYSTSKAALVHLVEALAEELKTIGITINAVAPGRVLSSMTEQARRGGKDPGQGYVSPDLAAQLIEFLMSPDARKVTGRLLSARFDQATVRQKSDQIGKDVHWYRLRRIDYDLFQPKSS